jgi:cephalosporin-C deacetylase-like acetyl esterase
MHPKFGFNKKETKKVCLVFITLILILLASNFITNFISTSKKNYNPSFSISENGVSFDILDFWETEIERVNNTPLNIVFGENRTIVFGENRTIEHINSISNKIYKLKAQDINFTSPNWVEALQQNITLRGLILYPEIIKSSNPGCLCMHGLNAEIEDAFELAIPYLEKGFIVLCHSHPGHGNSEGAEPESNNIFYTGAYNESAHFYLTLCGAIQGLRVLENLSFVNNSQIMVTGKSYGGLNAMWLASVAGERIAGILAYISIGDIAKNLQYPDKLIFWILGKSAEEISGSYLTNQLLRFDPIFYLKSTKLPPIMWQIGTNDEKFLQVFPNDHHGFPRFENSTKYFINFILNNGSAPPKVNITSDRKNYSLLGDSLKISLRVNSTVEIDSVQIVYKYIDIVGFVWQRFNLQKTGVDNWEGELNPAIVSSRLDYYIIVNLKNLSDVWFSSNIFSVGVMISNSTVPFVILVSFLIIFPFALSIWRKFNKISESDIEDKLDAKRSFLIEIVFIFILDLIYYISLIMPWMVYESGGVTLSHIYFFNNLYTWEIFFGEIASLLTIIFLTSAIINSHLNFISPMISAILKLIYPTIGLIFICVMPILSGILDPSKLISNFGLIYPGIGPFLMIISSISLFFVGNWERKIKIRLGLKKAKRKLNLKDILMKLKKKNL